MNLKTLVTALVSLASAASMAASQTVSSTCDLGTFTPTATDIYLQPSGGTNNAYTLSRDADFGTCSFYVNSGSARFDFSEGNHAIKVQTFVIANAKAPWVIMKGGTWNLGTGSGHDFRLYRYASVEGRTVVLDSCSVTNVDWLWGFQGANNTLVLKNKASLYSNTISLTLPGAVETTFYTNNSAVITGGSKLLWGNSNFEFDRGGSTAALTGNRITMSGGSLMKSSGSSGSISIGYTTSGNSLHVTDASVLNTRVYVGYAANAKYNVLRVDGGSFWTNTADMVIGNAAGADHNRVELVDSEFYGGEFNGIYVGSNGSSNELIVSNSEIKRCWFCCAGYNASSSNNTVRLIGNRTSIGGNSYETKLFGRGPNNTYILDGCSIGSESKTCYFAYESSSVKDVVAVGNTFKLVNGATLSEYDMSITTNCHDNTVYVGAGASIRTSHDFNVRGRDNHVVVSNGTLYVSASGGSLRFGKSTNDVDETGNMLVFQGSSPKVARIDPDNNYPAQFYNGAVLRSEVPEEDGYSGVIFDSTAVELRGTARLEFAGLDVCQRKFRRSRDMQLTSAAFRVFDSSGTDITTTYLAQLTAMLPDGCRVYRDGSNYLHLFVARKRLFCVSFR